MTTEFTKILVARKSPNNRCLGPDGAWLIPASNRDQPGFRLSRDDHYFVSIEGRAGNLFGWVSELDRAITAEELQALDRQSLEKKLGPQTPIEVPALDTYLTYLKAVSRNEPATPMACNFREVKLPGSERREITVHRVTFYRERS